MCSMKLALVAVGIFAMLVEALEDKASAFQEMVKSQLLKSPKLEKMLEDPEKMRETLGKISEQNNMPGFEDVDKLIEDLRAAAKAKKAKKKDGQASKSEKKKPAKKKENSPFSGMPGMENLQEMMSNPEKMKEAMNMPGMQNFQEMLTNPNKMKEAMDQLKEAGGMEGVMKKMKDDGHLDNLKEQLGGFDMDSMMDKLKDMAPGIQDMMSKFQSGEGMADVMENLKNLGANLGVDHDDNEEL